MRHVVWHWTGGAYAPNSIDRLAYNFLFPFDRETKKASCTGGVHPLEAQVPKDRLVSGEYAAHTLGFNSYSAGLSCAAMLNAVQAPGKLGPYPITIEQVELMLQATADICEHHGIDVTPTTTLCHSEVEKNCGIKQHNKWDIDVLPGAPVPKNDLHDWMRSQVQAMLKSTAESYFPTVYVSVARADGSTAKLPEPNGILDNGSAYCPLDWLLAATGGSQVAVRPGAWTAVVRIGLTFKKLGVRTYSGGSPFVSVRDYAEAFHLGLKWTNSTKSLVLEV